MLIPHARDSLWPTLGATIGDMRRMSPFRNQPTNRAGIAADREWLPLYHTVFRKMALTTPWTDELAQLAVTVADFAWLPEIAGEIIEQLDDAESKRSPTRELSQLIDENRSQNSVVPRLRAAFAPLFRRTEGEASVLMIEKVLGHIEREIAQPEGRELPPVAAELAERFALEDEELRALLVLFAIWELDEIHTVLRNQSKRSALRLVADMAELDVRGFSRLTSAGSKLERLGFLTFRGSRDEVLDLEVSRPLMYSLRAGSLDDLSAGILMESKPPSYRLEEFQVPDEEVETMGGMLSLGRSILIVGPPGIGKSEFALTVTAAMGRRPRKLTMDASAVESRRGGRESKMRMLMARIAGNLLHPEEEVLIVDEADSILQSAVGRFSIFAGTAGSIDKGELNELLEELPVPSIWIANEIDAVPSSAMRRFGHVYEFPRPDRSTRSRMLAEGLEKAGVTLASSVAQEISASYELTPSAIERMVSALKAVPPEDVERRARGYLRSRSGGPLASDYRKLPSPPSTFEPRFSAASAPLEELETLIGRRRERGRATRLLFEGPPGGGKTQGALYLARETGMEAAVYRPSDLLSPYVGVAEKNIARMFREAEERDTLLVLDEADALLTDRGSARHSWELTQAAEFLQGLQQFGGTLIACTNRVAAIDPALRRRFHHSVTFGSLPTELIEDALSHLFPGVRFTLSELRELSAGPPLMMSDLATAAEILDLEEPTADASISRASKIVQAVLANARSRDMSRDIGF